MDLRQDRRLDLQKSLSAQALANGPRNLMPQPEVALHLHAPQINVTVFEPRFLVLDGLFRRRKRRQPRVVQNPQLRRLNLHLAGRHLGIDRILVAQPHFAHRGHHVLRPHLLALEMPVRRQLFIQHHLRNAAAVAHIQKDQVAVVAAPVHPAHHNHLFACVRGAQFAAHVACVPDCLKSRAQRHSFVVFKRHDLGRAIRRLIELSGAPSMRVF